MLVATTAAMGAGFVPAQLAAQDSADLRMMWWGSQPRAERTFALIEKFEEANPGITVRGETVGWADYWTRLATQVAGRNAPDLIQQDYRYIFEYAGRGALLDLSPYLDDILSLPGVDETGLEGGMSDGKLWGINLGVNSVSLMVNATVFEEAGVALPENGMTWDEIMDLAQEVAEKSDRVRYGFEDSSGYEPTLHNWLRQRGKELYTAEGELAFDVDDMVEWYEFWQDKREAGLVPPADIQALDQRSIETHQVSLGNVAMGVANSNQLVGFSQINEDEIVMRVLPLVEEGATGGHFYKPSMLLSVSAATRSPEAAVAFVNFMATDPEAARILDVERGVSVSSVAREAMQDVLDDAGRAQIDFIESLDPYAGTLPPPPPQGAGEIDRLMIEVSQQVGFGQLSAQQGAERIVSEATRILARNN
ncbi:MAG: sugar ABC transporter substrate-binding protein [Roseinatronobacter sp.]|nr:MAG: sugar ABC transporter substrate-binding protein [Roseinatronobacter sp.]